MSYTESYKHTIKVPYSGRVWYPASDSGGYKDYDGFAFEDIYVDVNVNTTPFDSSVEECTEHVLGLTASVSAMNAAQCASVYENSKKISRTIVKGFFGTVKSDLSAQRAELEQVVEARLLLLRQQARSLLEKREQMEADYQRTSARYIKIFEDLNRELDVRVHQIDQPVFDTVKLVNDLNSRMQETDMIPSVSAVSAESNSLQAQLNVALTRNHALQAIGQAQRFLQLNAISAMTLEQSLVNGSGHDGYFIPVCFMQKIPIHGAGTDSGVYVGQRLSQNAQVSQEVSQAFLHRQSPDDKVSTQHDVLEPYMQREIAAQLAGGDPHTERVKDMIYKLFNEND